MWIANSLEIIMNIFDRLFAGDKQIFDIPVNELNQYLESLGCANNDIERSYKQYLGQLLYMSKKKSYFLNFVSIIAGAPLVLYYFVRGIFIKRSRRLDAICRSHDFNWMEIIPDSLAAKYKLDTESWNTKGAIHPKDIGFLVRVIYKNFLHPFFLLKITYKLAKYSALIHRFDPSAIIVHDEFSFTSSIMTALCERYNVKHINVQHGEKLFYLRDIFFRFHECYIWDEHYKSLLIRLKAEQSQFIIERPLAVRFNKEDHYHKEYYADYKYYLAIYDEQQISSIIRSMEFVEKSGKIVKFRPHPNYSDISLLRKFIPEEKIEYPSVHILDSVASAANVVGEYSTVLTQAFFNGINVILDDCTYKKRMDVLSDYYYILSSKVKERLSSYQSCKQ